jgi:hypothetical protein
MKNEILSKIERAKLNSSKLPIFSSVAYFRRNSQIIQKFAGMIIIRHFKA